MKVTKAGKSKSITVDTVREKDTCVGDACPYRPKRKSDAGPGWPPLQREGSQAVLQCRCVLAHCTETCHR